MDFRKMNNATIKDVHPLPRIDDTLEVLAWLPVLHDFGLEVWVLANPHQGGG